MFNFLFDFKKRRRPELGRPNPMHQLSVRRAAKEALLFKRRKGRCMDVPHSIGQGFSNTEIVHGPKVDLAGVRQLEAKVLGHDPKPIVRGVGTLRRR
jgi:hypothetical protein